MVKTYKKKTYKKYKKQTFAAKVKSVVAKTEETKQFSAGLVGVTGAPPSPTTTQILYGLGQGTSAVQRIGDSIQISGIRITGLINTPAATANAYQMTVMLVKSSIQPVGNILSLGYNAIFRNIANNAYLDHPDSRSCTVVWKQNYVFESRSDGVSLRRIDAYKSLKGSKYTYIGPGSPYGKNYGYHLCVFGSDNNLAFNLQYTIYFKDA